MEEANKHRDQLELEHAKKIQNRNLYSYVGPENPKIRVANYTLIVFADFLRTSSPASKEIGNQKITHPREGLCKR
jgi:hypothetical protein